jgi:ribosome-associated protein
MLKIGKGVSAMISDIPENEIEITFSRSSGPGGQNVNKTSTKVQLQWNVKNSSAFSEEQKDKIIAFYNSEILYASNQETRSQIENRIRAIKKLQNMLVIALREEKIRLATKPSFASRLKRLIQKQRHSQVKQLRKKPDLD